MSTNQTDAQSGTDNGASNGDAEQELDTFTVVRRILGRESFIQHWINDSENAKALAVLKSQNPGTLNEHCENCFMAHQAVQQEGHARAAFHLFTLFAGLMAAVAIFITPSLLVFNSDGMNSEDRLWMDRKAYFLIAAMWIMTTVFTLAAFHLYRKWDASKIGDATRLIAGPWKSLFTEFLLSGLFDELEEHIEGLKTQERARLLHQISFGDYSEARSLLIPLCDIYGAKLAKEIRIEENKKAQNLQELEKLQTMMLYLVQVAGFLGTHEDAAVWRACLFQSAKKQLAEVAASSAAAA